MSSTLLIFLIILNIIRIFIGIIICLDIEKNRGKNNETNT